jgi:hypothetical protein
MGTKTAQGVKYALRDPLILDNLPTNINKEEISEFTQKQIENFIFQTLKPKFLIKSSFNYGELFEWVKNHTSTPVDEHEPFVLDSWFDINDLIQQNKKAFVNLFTNNTHMR